MGYPETERCLTQGGIVVLDGGTGTELERRGVAMNPNAWCGPATLANADILESIHRDYIQAGADVITANTYASSRLMLAPAGFSDQFHEINRIAVSAAHRARQASRRDDVLVAGSLSHMCPLVPGTSRTDLSQVPSAGEMTEAFGELAALLCAEGCDLIILEMMYHPERMAPAFAAASESGLPVWAGFSARRGRDGGVLSFTSEFELPFSEILHVLDNFDVAAAGIMHTSSDLVADAITILRDVYDGPLMAYPDSGYFKMPNWQFEDVIPVAEYVQFATNWIENGVQIIGGCCGLSPPHIAALKPLKAKGQT